MYLYNLTPWEEQTNCQIIKECLVYFSMATVPKKMVGFGRMLDYQGVGMQKFHCVPKFTAALFTLLLFVRLFTSVLSALVPPLV